MGGGALVLSSRGWESDQEGQEVRSTVPEKVKDTSVIVGMFSWVYEE